MLHSLVRRAAPPLALLVLATAGVCSAAEVKAKAPAASTMLKAKLTGAAEKPTPGDPKGSGTASIRLDPAKEQVCYELQVKGIAPATMAHIHQAPATDAGPPVVELKAPGPDGKSSGCVAAGPALLKGLTDNPSAYYVNVHNAPYQGGAVRGQLGR